MLFGRIWTDNQVSIRIHKLRIYKLSVITTNYWKLNFVLQKVPGPGLKFFVLQKLPGPGLRPGSLSPGAFVDRLVYLKQLSNDNQGSTGTDLLAGPLSSSQIHIF